ncbi:hypothetical protein Ddye_025432 [Dipteronia dyeriana]|uniref:FRIGIDA-like protein n=1 Tax=Dipteronia dyeriana TaxID=168575 RepID=A0AAD9WPE9_9ROSI|nr:hypothetical protein Ddye_025432 [Dipteronia dyeriana]
MKKIKLFCFLKHILSRKSLSLQRPKDNQFELWKSFKLSCLDLGDNYIGTTVISLSSIEDCEVYHHKQLCVGGLDDGEIAKLLYKELVDVETDVFILEAPCPYPSQIKKKLMLNPFNGSSCVIILEQFMKLSPKIGLEIGKEANEMVIEWVRRMSDSFSKVFRFLLLLGAYKLAKHFGEEELRPFLKIVAQYR